MKIKTKNTVNYKGVFVEPGTEIDVRKDVAEYLIEQGAAEAAGRKPKTQEEVPEQDPVAEITGEDIDGDAEVGEVQAGSFESPIAG